MKESWVYIGDKIVSAKDKKGNSIGIYCGDKLEKVDNGDLTFFQKIKKFFCGCEWFWLNKSIMVEIDDMDEKFYRKE